MKLLVINDLIFTGSRQNGFETDVKLLTIKLLTPYQQTTDCPTVLDSSGQSHDSEGPFDYRAHRAHRQPMIC